MLSRLPAVMRFGLATARRLRAHLRDADAAMRAGDWNKAETDYAAALAIDPGRWPLQVQRGHALKEQGFLGGAERAYRAALTQAPAVADTYLQLGHVLKLQDRKAEAAAAYGLAFRLAPGHPDSGRELEHLGATLPEPEDPAKLARALRSGGGRQPRPEPSPLAPPGSLAAHLAAADLTPAFLPLFDEVFYVDANPAVRRALPVLDRISCLAHFCEAGLAGLLPINPDKIVDPAFYRDTYLGGRAIDPAAAYRHWLVLGLPQGWAANRNDWLDRNCGIGPRRAAMLPAAARIALVAIARRGAWIDGFDEMQAAGGFASGAPAAGALLGAFADRAARLAAGDADERALGTRLDGRILAVDAGHAGAMARTAERLRREGFFDQALPIDAALVDSPARSVAATLGLAACFDAVGAPERALDALATARTHFAGDTRLDRAFDAIAPRLLHRAFRLAMARGLTGSVGEADAGLAQAVAHVAGLVEPKGTRPSRPIRSVAIIGNGDLPQCRFYRIEAKLQQLTDAGLAAAVFDFRTAVPAYLGQLHRFDAAIFYRVPADHAVITAIARSRAVGVVTIYEIDDLIFDADHYPEPLESYGGAIGARDHLGLRLGVPLFSAAMRLCDIGLASTPSLAAAMTPLVRSGNVFVQRNALGAAHEAAAKAARPPRDASHVTLVYGSGTRAHAADFSDLVAPALVTLVRRHGARIHIVLVGDVPTAGLEAIAGQITQHPALPLEAFWSVLATADINIAVLKPSAMADAKSEIKWLEAAMLGVPSVVSDTATYRAAIDPGVDGFLCTTPQDWLDTLDRLVADPDLRRRVGARARATVLERYGRQAAADNLAGLFRALSPPDVSQKPKVLLVNVYYPPQTIGGATRVLHDNTRTLMQTGAFVIEVFTSTDGGATPYARSTYAQDGVRVTAATIPQRDDIDRVLDDPAMGTAFAAFLQDSRPDLIHFHCVQRLTIAVVDAARAAGIPYLITAHDGWWVSDEQFIVDRFGTPLLYTYADPAGTRRRLGEAAAARMERLRPALFGAAQVLAVSHAFAALYAGCGVPRVLAVPNGLSGDIGGPRAPSPLDRLRLGFFGGMHDHKGWRLVEAALRTGAFDEFTLLVVDHALPAGEEQHAIFGATPVTFVPRTPPDAVAGLYGRIDIMLAPSIWPESFGLVVREALACGCWVVASDRGALADDVVPGENGFVIDVAGPDGLAAALYRIAANPDRYRAPPAAQAPLRTATQQGHELAALYKTLLGAAPPLDRPPPLMPIHSSS